MEEDKNEELKNQLETSQKNNIDAGFEKINNSIDRINENISSNNKLMRWCIVVLGSVSIGLIVYIFTLLFVK